MSATLKLMRALGDATRLRIILLLERDELSVNELQEITRMGQSRISTHLKQLQDAEMVQSRRDGKRTFYRLNPAADNLAREFVEIARRASKEIPEHSSERIVEFGISKAKKNGLKNLEFRLGDLENPPIAPQSVDLVVLSQALHHAKNPANTIHAAFQLLRSGGQIMILDLLQHKFEKA